MSRVWTHYGLILVTLLRFGHVFLCHSTNVQINVMSLGAFRTQAAELDTFWASFGHKVGFGHIYGHIMGTFGSFASKMCLSPHRAPVPLSSTNQSISI